MKEEHESNEVNCFEILMGDVEDPDLMIADPIYKWQQTDEGKYIMENSDPIPKWVRDNSPDYMGNKKTKHLCYWWTRFYWSPCCCQTNQ